MTSGRAHTQLSCFFPMRRRTIGRSACATNYRPHATLITSTFERTCTYLQVTTYRNYTKERDFRYARAYVCSKPYRLREICSFYIYFLFWILHTIIFCCSVRRLLFYVCISFLYYYWSYECYLLQLWFKSTDWSPCITITYSAHGRYLQNFP